MAVSVLDGRAWASVGGSVFVTAFLGFLLAVGWPRRGCPSLRHPLRAFILSVAFLSAAHAVFIVVARHQPSLYYTVNNYWPFRIFSPRFALLVWPDVAFFVLGLGAVALSVRRGCSETPLDGRTILALTLLLLVTFNASQGGVESGLTGAVSNPPIRDQMYDDAVDLPAVGDLLRTYADPDTIRHWRSPHTKSHPPLALFALAACRTLGMSPFAVGLLLLGIASLAPCLALLLYRRLRPRSPRAAGRLALLLALTPAFNIYGGTSVEGPFLTLAIATAVTFVPTEERRTRLRAFLGGLSFTILCLYSFGGLWMMAALPCLAFVASPRYAFALRARIFDALLFLTPMLAAYSALRWIGGYDYVAHLLRVASEGMAVHWLSSPLLAVGSRLQNVGELILLGSPLLVGAWLHVAARLRRARSAPAARLAAPGLALLALLVLTPIYSEFARGWLLLAPILLLPCLPWLRRRETAVPVVAATGCLTALWQCFGYFAW